MLDKWTREHRKWVAKFNKELEEDLRKLKAMPGTYCDGHCLKKFPNNELKRLKNSRNENRYCPQCYKKQIKIRQVEDMTEKELTKLFSRLDYDENIGQFGRVGNALRKINPFNEVLQDSWWCWGKNWFEWITQDMIAKDIPKQRRWDKEREERFCKQYPQHRKQIRKIYE